MAAAYLTPRVDQDGDVFARLQSPHEEKVRRGGRAGFYGPQPGRRGFRNGGHTIGLQAEALDRGFADALGRRHDHGGDAALEEWGRAPADATGAMVPRRVEPRRKIVQGKDAGPLRAVGNGEIGTV